MLQLSGVSCLWNPYHYLSARFSPHIFLEFTITEAKSLGYNRSRTHNFFRSSDLWFQSCLRNFCQRDSICSKSRSIFCSASKICWYAEYLLVSVYIVVAEYLLV